MGLMAGIVHELCMFKVGGLDGEKAALRLLLVLAYSQVPIPRLEFIKHAKEVGVGRTAFLSSLDTRLRGWVWWKISQAEVRGEQWSSPG